MKSQHETSEEYLTNSLLSAHPNFLVVLDIHDISQLHLPHLQLVAASISLACDDIERPVMLRTHDTGRQSDPKILNIEKIALREGE